MQKQKLAEQLGVTTSAICQWEKKGKIPSDRLFEVADIIKISAKKLKDNPSLLFDKFVIKRPQS